MGKTYSTPNARRPPDNGNKALGELNFQVNTGLFTPRLRITASQIISDPLFTYADWRLLGCCNCVLVMPSVSVSQDMLSPTCSKFLHLSKMMEQLYPECMPCTSIEHVSLQLN